MEAACSLSPLRVAKTSEEAHPRLTRSSPLLPIWIWLRLPACSFDYGVLVRGPVGLGDLKVNMT